MSEATTHDPIDFYVDFSSPYSYLAGEWIEGLAARHGRGVRWHAILLGATFQATGLQPLVSYPLKGDYSRHDMARSARFLGVPLEMPQPFPVSTVNAARVFWWLDAQDPRQAVRWAQACMRAFFTRNLPLNEARALKDLAAGLGIDPAAAEAAWNDAAVKAKLKVVNDAAIAAGVFGAPWFVVDGEPFWGNDRRPQLERWLASGPF